MKKEDKIKYCNKFFKFLFLICFVTFITLYISSAAGYYEYEQHKKMVFTQDQIKQFEQDVANGKNIDLEEYMKNTNPNYQNRTSKFGLKISEGIGTAVQKGIEGAFSMLNKLVEE